MIPQTTYLLPLTNGELKSFTLIETVKPTNTPNLYDVIIIENQQRKRRQATGDAINIANIPGVRI